MLKFRFEQAPKRDILVFTFFVVGLALRSLLLETEFFEDASTSRIVGLDTRLDPAGIQFLEGEGNE